MFASGQVALEPRNNEFLGGDIRQQTERAMENIKAVVEAAGSNLHHVVKTTVFLKDMNDFAAMNEAYGKYCPAAPHPPAPPSKSGAPQRRIGQIEVIAAL